MPRDHRPTIMHIVHSLEGGGTERTLLALLQRLNPQRYRHRVVTLRKAGSLSTDLPGYVSCRALQVDGDRWLSGVTLGRTARNHGPAILHARNIGCWADAIVARCLMPSAKLVLGFHGLEQGGVFSASQRWKAQLGRLAGARFCSVSQSGSRKIHEVFGVAQDKVTVLPNGVDVDRFSACDKQVRRRVRAGLGVGPGGLLVGTVGSLSSVKGYLALVEAVGRVAVGRLDIDLVIVGQGPLRNAILERARQCGLADRVHLVGQRTDVAEHLSACDAYVCSSESEGMSNALLEAMAVGLPLLVTDVGDNASLVRSGVEGLVVQPGSVDALALGLQSLVADPMQRVAMAGAARRRAQAFSIDRSVNNYERFYDELLQRGTATRGSEVHIIGEGAPASAQEFA